MDVRLSKEQKIKILNSADVYSTIQQILLRENKTRRNKEHFWVIGLDNQNKILFIKLIGLGAVKRIGADLPDIFRMAIYKLAVKMILVHNHPSGNLKPSQADLDFTDKMLKVGKLISIEVIDYLVISEKGYASFVDEGILADLKKSGMFEIVKRDQLEIKERKLQVEKDRAIKESNLETDKKIKEDGIDIDRYHQEIC